MFRDYYYIYEFDGPQTVKVCECWCEAGHLGLEEDWNDICNQIHKASQNYSRKDILVFKYEADAIKALEGDTSLDDYANMQNHIVDLNKEEA